MLSFPFPSPDGVLGLCRTSQRNFSPSKRHLERTSYSTALVRPHHSGDSPEISQTMAVMQKPHQCIYSMNLAGKPLLLSRCKISTPSHGIPQSRGKSTPNKPEQSRFFLLPITALLGATEMKFIPPWAQGDLEL